MDTGFCFPIALISAQNSTRILEPELPVMDAGFHFAHRAFVLFYINYFFVM